MSIILDTDIEQKSPVKTQDGLIASTGDRTPMSDITPQLFFDLEEIYVQIDALAQQHGGNETALRQALLEVLKPLKELTHTHAEELLHKTGKGHLCAGSLSLFQDELIRLLYTFTLRYIYQAVNPSKGEHLAILATGGYGRELLAPGSDIDLMFLFPFKQTAWGESVVEYILYFLWDLGFKVGHATRSLDQAIRLAKSDFTIRTALLDSRCIAGDKDLFDVFFERFQSDIVEGNEVEFINAKLEERDARHQRAGRSRYRVEPNIKDGKGGLRDLDTLYWIAKYVSEGEKASDFVETGIFNKSEYRQFVRCKNFLWTVRCHLHFMTGRSEERLTFDLQEELAHRLKYKGQNGLRAVERFMRHYFLVAKKVGTLTRVVCASMELKHKKLEPPHAKILSWLGFQTLSTPSHSESTFKVEGYKLENGRLMVKDRSLFRKNPIELIKVFYLVEKYKLNFHPDILRLIHSCFSLIDDTLRNDLQANKIFLELLCSPTNSEKALRAMNEAGVLGRFIPDFGKVVSMMQFNMYHHYTVDEHLLKSVGILNEIETGQSFDEHPIASKVFNTVANRRALYVAMFLHDIAKGRDEDHSIAGARIAQELCPRFGMTQTETDLVSWLIENHLVMSMVAQNRDIQDPKTISDFADIVRTKERLNLLLILTVADIRAVGPGVWNGWKRQLLRSLYFATKHALAQNENDLSEGEQIESEKKALSDALVDWSTSDIITYAQSHYPDYWLRTETDMLVKHAHLVQNTQSKGNIVGVDINTDKRKDITELTLYTPDKPKLLVHITGACVLSDANIVEAQIYTTRDQHALDTILISRSFDYEEDERRRANRITKTLEKFISGQKSLKDISPSSYQASARKSVFPVPSEVTIDNSLSDNFSVMEIRSLDRPGLLFHITQCLNELRLDVASAHISTFGAQAVDTFYISDAKGDKILEPSRIKSIKKFITSFLEEHTPVD